MIKLFVGENSYEIHEAVHALIDLFEGEIERYDGEDIDANKMAEICGGLSLFSSEKMVVINELSKNKSIWENLESWLERVSDDTILVLVEFKPDKRTKTYKSLIKVAEVNTFDLINDRDTQKAEKWLIGEAKTRKIKIDQPAVRELVSRIGVDQWSLSNELNRLSVMGDITIDTVRDYTEASVSENVFVLLETAVKGSATELHETIAALKISNDSYMTFGLLSSQVLSISALVLDKEDSAGSVAKDIGQSEYVLSKLRPLARRMSKTVLETVITRLADTDKMMKSTDDPWQSIESFLLYLRDEITQ